jgi:hypothetical protein
MSAISSGKNSVISAAPDQLSSKLGSEVVILNLNSGVYYGLDPVGTRIWELLQQAQPLAAIRDQIVSEFDVTPEQCEQDLIDLLKQMEQEGLIKVTPGK